MGNFFLFFYINKTFRLLSFSCKITVFKQGNNSFGVPPPIISLHTRDDYCDRLPTRKSCHPKCQMSISGINTQGEGCCSCKYHGLKIYEPEKGGEGVGAGLFRWNHDLPSQILSEQTGRKEPVEKSWWCSRVGWSYRGEFQSQLVQGPKGKVAWGEISVDLIS